jgi:hypothetical protein
VNADVWSAVGQVGSFVVAILALLFAIASRKDSKEALFRAARSATAAEVSAQAAKAAVREAKRANELTESERRERARADAARAQLEADLVRGSIMVKYVTPDGWLKVAAVVENHSSQPALDVMFWHTKNWPNPTLIARAIPPGERQEFDFEPDPRVHSRDDNSDFPFDAVFEYKLGGVRWIRRGKASPVQS